MSTSESQFAASKEKFPSEEEEVRLSPEQEERFNQINTRLQEIINIKDDPKKWNSLDLNEMQELADEFKGLRQEKRKLEGKEEEFESLLSLKEQYDSQLQILKNAGLIEKLPSGQEGIKGIDGQEYPLPAYERITERMNKNQEMLKTKIEQGFTQLLIVPFGIKLDDLIDEYRQVILKHHQQGKLLATKKDPSDHDTPLELDDFDQEKPVLAWDKYQNADLNGELIYYPQEFSQNHQGLTKKEILQGKKPEGWPASQSFSKGWNILLIEDLPNIPKQDQGKTISERKQLEAGKSPQEYLQILQNNPIYQNETGMTPEDQITYAIAHLEKTNQVIDDYQGQGSISYQTGSYFSASGSVPDAYWSRVHRRVCLGGGIPDSRDDAWGVRSAVRI